MVVFRLIVVMKWMKIVGFGQDFSTAVPDDACTPCTVVGVGSEADHVLGRGGCVLAPRAADLKG